MQSVGLSFEDVINDYDKAEMRSEEGKIDEFSDGDQDSSELSDHIYIYTCFSTIP